MIEHSIATLADGDPCPVCTFALSVDREGPTVHSAHCICCGLDLLTPRLVEEANR